MTRTIKALGLGLWGFIQRNPAFVFSLLMVVAGILLQDVFAQQQGGNGAGGQNTNTGGGTDGQNQDAIASSVTSAIQSQIQGIICPLARLLVGPIARIISLLVFIGAIIYYLTNDSRTAKGLAVAAVIALILANTFPTWQQLFTGEPISNLCKSWK